MRPPETPQELNIYELWRAVGVIVGFQITVLGWRILREQRLAERERPAASWFPIADYLNVLSIAISVIFVFVIPILTPLHHVRLGMLGVDLLLFAAFPFALIGHYQFFTPKFDHPDYFPCQEKIVVAITVVLVIVFSIWYYRTV